MWKYSYSQFYIKNSMYGFFPYFGYEVMNSKYQDSKIRRIRKKIYNKLKLKKQSPLTFEILKFERRLGCFVKKINFKENLGI